MGNPFSAISDALSDFAGEVSDAWTGGSTAGEDIYLSYPRNLGNSESAEIYYDNRYDSMEKFSSQRAQDTNDKRVEGLGHDDEPEQFLFFEIYRVVEPEDVYAESGYAKLKDRQKTAKTQSVLRGQGLGRTGVQKGSEYEVVSRQIKTYETLIGKRYIQTSIALYMPPAITLSDSQVYNQHSRKLAAVATEAMAFANKVKFFPKEGEIGFGDANVKEDLKVAAAYGAELALTGIGFLAKNTPGLKKFSDKLGGLGSALGGYALGGVIKDEAMLNMSKQINPHEYMHYTSTGLRQFSFAWKFLPDSAQESLDVQHIIRKFRASAAANRKSSVTLTVPDQVILSFQGVSGMPALPPLVITNVSVTYNPNASSFFEVDNAPVEVDLAITLQEINPIYRQDIEEKGY